MGVRFEWRGEEAKDYIRNRTNIILAMLLEFAIEHAREITSIQGPPRSRPGEPPHRDKGPLHDDINGRIMIPGQYAVFGTGAPEGRYTEYGTDRMAARPWIRPTIDLVTERLQNIQNQPLETLDQAG